MPDIDLNGHQDQQDQGHFTSASKQHQTDSHIVNGDNIDIPAPLEEVNPPSSQNDDGPTAKRRKIADSNKSSPRPVSPPWRRSHAEGPTSFLENGIRKSGRTNAVPLDLQPQSGKRQTRTAFHKQAESHKSVKPSYSLSQKKAVNVTPHKDTVVTKRGPGRPPKPRTESPELARKEMMKPKAPSPASKRLAELEAELAALQKKARRRSSTKEHLDGFIKEESDASEESDTASERAPTPPLTITKVAFRVRLPKPTIATPANFPQPKQYSSFSEFLDHDELEPKTGQDLLSPSQIRREAIVRQKVIEAREPGGILHRRRLDSLPEKQGDLRKHYAHRDHLLIHVAHFRKLMRDERRQHRKDAELLAHEAKRYVENKIKGSRVKTKDELQQEEFARNLAIFRTVVKDMDKLWTAVFAEVQAQRVKEYEDQQQMKMKGHLARVLDRTDQMLNRNDSSMMNTDDDDDDDDDDDESDEDSEHSEQMSRSGSESSSASEADDGDADMTLDELRLKYANVPEVEKTPKESEVDMSSRPASIADDEDSDPETEMDSEFDTDEDEDEDEADEVEDDEEEPGGLQSLFSKQEISQMMPEDSEQPEDSAVVTDIDMSTKQQSIADDADEEDSDPETEMDSELDTNESDEEGSDQEDDESEEAGQGLLSLFSKQEVEAMASEDEENENAPDPQPVADEAVSRNQSPLIEELDTADKVAAKPPALEDIEMRDHPLPQQLAEVIEEAKQMSEVRASSEEQVSHEPSTQASPVEEAEPESVSSVEPQTEEPIDVTMTEEKPSTIQTPVPSMLRGNLRIYQHEGLDWLANLYANGRSGILADEMGLGKTIQSIAVLAHLAEVHEVWGPHLIVVPTSVMLNWEMEFKKFLTWLQNSHLLRQP